MQKHSWIFFILFSHIFHYNFNSLLFSHSFCLHLFTTCSLCKMDALVLLLVVLVLLHPSLSHSLSLSETLERDVLLHLYQATTPSAWINATNWGSNSTHHCDWYGVHCQDANETTPRLVSSLRLPSNNLISDMASPFPLSLSALSSMSILQLYNNTNLAFTISSLPRSLVFVQLSRTSLSGPLPSSFSNLNNLFSLDASSTLVIGPFPTSLAERCTRKPSGFAEVDCNFVDTPLFSFPCGAGMADQDRAEACASSGDYGPVWTHLTCLPCPRCTAFGGCLGGFDSYENMCTLCPDKTVEMFDKCVECPSNTFSAILMAFLLPASVAFFILAIFGIVFALHKYTAIRFPTFSFGLKDMIRLKQISAALQILTVFAQLSAFMAPWFRNVVSIALTISAPVEIQPVCTSWFQAISEEYYFVRSYMALAVLFFLTFLLRNAHKVPAFKARASPTTFAKLQKAAALITINIPIVVLPLALRPPQMLTSYFKKFHVDANKDFDVFVAASSGFFLSLISAAIISFVLHRTIRITSSQFKVLRRDVLREIISAATGTGTGTGTGTDMTAITWEDINKNRPYIAAFCTQSCEYQHEEKAVWRKILSIVGIISGEFLALGVAEGSCMPGVVVFSQSFFSTVFIATNLIYTRHLLRRPYISHRRSRRMGDPLNDSELLTIRTMSWAASILTMREAVLQDWEWSQWTADAFGIVVLAALTYSQLPLFYGLSGDAKKIAWKVKTNAKKAKMKAKKLLKREEDLTEDDLTEEEDEKDLDPPIFHSSDRRHSTTDDAGTGVQIEKMLLSESFREILLLQSKLNFEAMDPKERSRWQLPLPPSPGVAYAASSVCQSMLGRPLNAAIHVLFFLSPVLVFPYNSYLATGFCCVTLERAVAGYLIRRIPASMKGTHMAIFIFSSTLKFAAAFLFSHAWFIYGVSYVPIRWLLMLIPSMLCVGIEILVARARSQDSDRQERKKRIQMTDLGSVDTGTVANPVV